MRRPIKHILDDTVTDEAGAVVRTINLVQGVSNADPYAAAQSQVNAGAANVFSMDLMLEVAINGAVTGTGQLNRFDWYVWFNIAGAQSAPDPRTAGQSDLKNQIIHMDQALMGQCTTALSSMENTAMGRCTWHIPIHIPKWATAINKDDAIQLVYVHSDAAANKWLKMKVIFKEYEQA